MNSSLTSLPMKKFFSSLILGSLLITLTACGKNSGNKIVRNVKLETTMVEDQVFLESSAVFNLGVLTMNALQVGIRNPKDPQVSYGEFSVRPTLDGTGNEIGLKLNLSSLPGVRVGAATLPNGNQLPIGGLSGVKIYELSIEAIRSKIYLALQSNAVMLGFAIVIEQFDQLGTYTGPINLFPGFNIKGVKGIAGLFSGSEPATSGLGFFVDLSAVLTPDIINALLNRDSLSAEEFSVASTKSSGNVIKSKLDFTKGMKGVTKKQIAATNKFISELSKSDDTTLDYIESLEE